MSDFTVGSVKPRTDEEYQAAIEALLAEIQRSEERMEARHAQIERLKAETKAIRAESAAIRKQTQARLDTLEKWTMPYVG